MKINWQDLLNTASAVWGLFGGLLVWIIGLLGGRFRRWFRLKALRRAAPAGAVALCVRVGGKGDPLPDVQAYLEQHQPNIKTVLNYQAPTDIDLADAATAEGIIEDLREAISEYGQERILEVHLFFAGMVAYPFALGSLLGNWGPVVVYHLKSGTYVPLYRLSKEWLHATNRTAASVAHLEVRATKAVRPAPTPEVLPSTDDRILPPGPAEVEQVQQVSQKDR